ncbi:hypothetical protein [Alterinioella nitratireducens]|uniref:hypothetical protein n=1 Tax=Alterinioella nitratireducens TaxID=2735915 RepID=UPI00155449E6|nr:hypothetical protein [Alterinioella nitratireducens]
MDDDEAWVASMSARGYVRGPDFSSYEELSAWDDSNTRPHVRRLIGDKYQVYFTDGLPNVDQVPTAADVDGPSYDITDVPF